MALFWTLTYALVTIVVAPVNAAPTCLAINQNANFDELSTLPVAVDQVPSVPAGYRGLYFQSFEPVRHESTTLFTGVIPHSGSNIGVATVTSQSKAGTAMMTVNYPNTNTSSFSLLDFYFGCEVNLENGVANGAIACIISIAGYQGYDTQMNNAKQVCAHMYEYSPSSYEGAQQMAFTGAISGCTDVQFVKFTFSPIGGFAAGQATLALELDDVRFTSKKC